MDNSSLKHQEHWNSRQLGLQKSQAVHLVTGVKRQRCSQMAPFLPLDLNASQSLDKPGFKNDMKAVSDLQQSK